MNSNHKQELARYGMFPKFFSIFDKNIYTFRCVTILYKRFIYFFDKISISLINIYLTKNNEIQKLVRVQTRLVFSDVLNKLRILPLAPFC